MSTEGQWLSRNIQSRISQRRFLLIGSALALIVGVGIGFAWEYYNSAPFHSAQFQCPQPNVGERCPYEFIFLSGHVNVTSGLPYVILFSDTLYTSTAGIFYENGHYGYGLYIPINTALYGGTLTVNGTAYPSGTPLQELYHVTIRYFLSNSTSGTCTPQPSYIVPTLSESQTQDFAC